MVKEDIHNTSRILENTSERYIAKLNPEDQVDVRQFMDDLLARGFSPARVIKYLSSMVSISKRLDVSLKTAKSGDLKKFAAWLEKSDYSDWTKQGLKIILKKYIRQHTHTLESLSDIKTPDHRLPSDYKVGDVCVLSSLWDTHLHGQSETYTTFDYLKKQLDDALQHNVASRYSDSEKHDEWVSSVGEGKSQRDKINLILKAIPSDNTTTTEGIQKETGLSQEYILAAIARLKRDEEIVEIKEGVYRRIL